MRWSSCPPSSIPLFNLVCGKVRDEPGGGVGFLFWNETEGLTFLPQNNDYSDWGLRQTIAVEWRHLDEQDQRRRSSPSGCECFELESKRR